MWIEYFNKEVHFFHREDYYLAQIATEIRRGLVKNPKQVGIKDFILSFAIKEDNAMKKQKQKKSKTFWLKALGIKAK